MVDNNENEGGDGAAEAPEKTDESTETSTENEEVQAGADESTSEESEAASADAPAEDEAVEAAPGKLGVTAELPPVSAKPSASVEDTVTAWPIYKDHRSAVDMLVQEAADVDLSPDPEAGGGGGMMNLMLIVGILAAAIGGAWQLSVVSSEEAMELKRAERLALEEAHMAEQLAKQKKYGVLRIESAPEQAVVIKDGEKIMVEFAPAPAVPVDPAAAPGEAPKADAPAAAATAEAPKAPAADPAAAGTPGEKKPGMTPMNIMNLDIGATYKFRIEKDGYEPFEFAVAEHLWTKDPGSGEYKFFKMIEMTPINCEYWFLYDAKKRREVQFKEKGECLTYHDQSVSQQASVTECTCKIPPEGVVPAAGAK